MRRRSIVPAGLALAVLALSAPSALASGTLNVNKRGIGAGDTRLVVGDDAGKVTGTYVDKTGPGESATVTAIDCGSTCSAFISDDEGACPVGDDCPVTETAHLSATAQTGWSFADWTGACTGTGACSVSMSGNRSVTANYQDVQDPTVALIAPPAGPRRETTLSAEATGTDNWRVDKVEFLLDGVVVATDPTPGDGFTHTFDVASKDTSFTIGVRSVDPAGRQSAVVSRTYTVDRVGPAPGFTSGPPANGIIGASEATFEFSASDASALTWTCRLDGAEFGACTSNSSYRVTGLADGPHTVIVRATDSAGNTGEASRAFTVNAVRPGVTITDGPAEGAIIRAAQTSIRFAATGGAAECSLDSATSFRPCTSADTDSLTGLADGAHTFRVRVRDEVGDEVLASRTFRVDTSEPPKPPKLLKILNPTLFSRSDAFPRYTIFKRLVLNGVPAGSKVTVRCKGKKCPAKRLSKTGRGSVKLRKFTMKRLRVGTTLTIRVTRADAIGKQFVLKIRKRKTPKLTITQIT